MARATSTPLVECRDVTFECNVDIRNTTLHKYLLEMSLFSEWRVMIFLLRKSVGIAPLMWKAHAKEDSTVMIRGQTLASEIHNIFWYANEAICMVSDFEIKTS
ncbi:hypothetical protein CEXT_20791 [Caerostris extrusa]|uniref:Uncharacterized protein n=1 Tax=Caerostris extrusa TaxID=172846 RepID=A0AAV4SYF9_CAEEX|nr:hypothetical protein CEXT_20791 [Caerostris extrusa]